MIILEIYRRDLTREPLLVDELDITDWTPEQRSMIIAHNSNENKWCRVKPAEPIKPTFPAITCITVNGI